MHHSSTSVTHLDNYCVLAISGTKAHDLLQGQLTCDMSTITTAQARAAALCNLKGRVVALMTVVKIDLEIPTYYLIIPVDLITSVLTHLGKLAPLFRVNIEDIRDKYHASAIIGKESCQLIKQVYSCSIDTANYAVTQSHGTIFINLATPEQQVVLAILDTTNSEKITHQLASTDNNNWQLALINAGIAAINSSNTDMFLPQLLNIQHYGGLSFTKGCYLGQEVIARTYYRGKLKKTLCLIKLTTTASLYPATKLLSIDQQPLGQLVNCTLCDHDTYRALALINNDYLADNLDKKLTVNLADHIKAQLKIEKVLEQQFYT
jgi:folate-binding protein YgfZ